jgi:hypothetical protein
MRFMRTQQQAIQTAAFTSCGPGADPSASLLEESPLLVAPTRKEVLERRRRVAPGLVSRARSFRLRFDTEADLIPPSTATLKTRKRRYHGIAGDLYSYCLSILPLLPASTVLMVISLLAPAAHSPPCREATPRCASLSILSRQTQHIKRTISLPKQSRP